LVLSEILEEIPDMDTTIEISEDLLRLSKVSWLNPYWQSNLCFSEV
jgi:hypothetical protein